MNLIMVDLELLEDNTIMVE